MNQNTATAFACPNPDLAARLREAMATYGRRHAEAMGVPAPADDDLSDLEAMLADVLAEPEEKAAEPARAAPSVKSVKSGRPVSILREAATAQELQAFATGRCKGLRAAGPVYLRGEALSFSHPHTSTTTAAANDNAAIILDGVPEAPQVQIQTKPSRRPWWTSFSMVDRGKPQAWRFLSDHLKADAAFYAAWQQAQDADLVVWAFSANLGDEIITKALAAPSAADYLGRRVDWHVRSKLGLDAQPLTFTAIEDRVGSEWFDDRKLHAHGWLIAREDQEDDVREALEAAGGDYQGSGAQVKLERVYSVGWATYCTKCLHWTRTADRMHPSFAPSFKGSPIKISASLRRHAEAFYEAFREDFSCATKLETDGGGKKHQSNLIVAPHFLSSTSILGLTAGFIGLTKSWSICIGELQCSPSTTSPTLFSPTWPTILWTSRPAPAAPMFCAGRASVTTRSSSTRSTAPRLTATPSSSRSRTPAAFCRSAWPWRSSRIRSGTGASSSRGPPSRAETGA